MTFLSTILGFLMIICGILCFFSPVQTFLATGIFVGFMFLVYGIAGLVRAFQGKSLSIEIIFSILSIALGVFSFTRPNVRAALDQTVLIFISIWFIVHGAAVLYASFKIKGISWRWILGLIAGALSIVLGIYSLIHPMISIMAVGILVGCYFIESGFSMITFSALAEIIKKDLGIR